MMRIIIHPGHLSLDVVLLEALIGIAGRSQKRIRDLSFAAQQTHGPERQGNPAKRIVRTEEMHLELSTVFGPACSKEDDECKNWRKGRQIYPHQ